MNNWPRIIQRWLYPPTCLLCGDAGSGQRDLCEACLKSLPASPARCIRCASSLAAAGPLLCSHCVQQPPSFDSTTVAFDYEEPVRYLIHELKFHARYACGRLLGSLLADAVAASRSDRPECLLPVPLHSCRYHQRGFNHTLELARAVSRDTGIPIDVGLVKRVRSTHPQVGLAAEERMRNVRNAFEVSTRRGAGFVAIVDDVITTGATVNEMAKTLKAHGVERVAIYACARADRFPLR